jgi:hypothetical protein
VFFKQVPEMALASQAREQIRVGTGILAYVAARVVIKTNGIGYIGPEDYEAMTDLVMKYLAKESDQRPGVRNMMRTSLSATISRRRRNGIRCRRRPRSFALI